MAPLRVWLSWSSGKDSAYTLHKLRQEPQKYEVVGLLTTLNEVADRVAMHAVRSELLVMQAQATGLPVHQVNADSCSHVIADVCLLHTGNRAGVICITPLQCSISVPAAFNSAIIC